MDVENLFTEGRDEEDWQKWIYHETSVKSKTLKNIDFPSYQEFRKIGWFKVPPPKENTIMLKNFREDPIKFPLSTPSGKIEIYSKFMSETCTSIDDMVVELNDDIDRNCDGEIAHMDASMFSKGWNSPLSDSYTGGFDSQFKASVRGTG